MALRLSDFIDDLDSLPESRNNFREVNLTVTSRKLFLLSGSSD
jgi:hypothetical protein